MWIYRRYAKRKQEAQEMAEAYATANAANEAARLSEYDSPDEFEQHSLNTLKQSTLFHEECTLEQLEELEDDVMRESIWSHQLISPRPSFGSPNSDQAETSRHSTFRLSATEPSTTDPTKKRKLFPLWRTIYDHMSRSREAAAAKRALKSQQENDTIPQSHSEYKPTDSSSTSQPVIEEEDIRTKQIRLAIEHLRSLKRFKFCQLLGRGAFGRVFLVREASSKQLFALKVQQKPSASTQDSLTSPRAYLLRRTLMEKEILHALATSDPTEITNTSENHSNITVNMTGMSRFVNRLRFSFQTNHHLFLGLNFVSGGTLKDFLYSQPLRRLPLHRTRVLSAEILMGLAYLHSSGVIYRDLKPDNVMLTASGHAQLIDFGLSMRGVTTSRGAVSLVGTPQYLAPEIILTAMVKTNRSLLKKNHGVLPTEVPDEQEESVVGGTVEASEKNVNTNLEAANPPRPPMNRVDQQRSMLRAIERLSIEDANEMTGKQLVTRAGGGGYGRSADMWSLGVLIYEMLTGIEPFRGSNIYQTYQNILHAPLKLDHECFTPEICSLLSGLHQRDPMLRLGAWSSPPTDIMNHAFFSSINWSSLTAGEKEPLEKNNEEDGEEDSDNSYRTSSGASSSSYMESNTDVSPTDSIFLSENYSTVTDDNYLHGWSFVAEDLYHSIASYNQTQCNVTNASDCLSPGCSVHKERDLNSILDLQVKSFDRSSVSTSSSEDLGELDPKWLDDVDEET